MRFEGLRFWKWLVYLKRPGKPRLASPHYRQRRRSTKPTAETPDATVNRRWSRYREVWRLRPGGEGPGFRGAFGKAVDDRAAFGAPRSPGADASGSNRGHRGMTLPAQAGARGAWALELSAVVVRATGRSTSRTRRGGDAGAWHRPRFRSCTRSRCRSHRR